MIWTKTYFSKNIIGILCISILLSACNKVESLTFQTSKITTDSLFPEECRDIDCANIEINLIEAIENSALAEAVNSEIEKVITADLTMSQETAESTIQKAAIDFNDVFKKNIEEFPDETHLYEAIFNTSVSLQNDYLISILVNKYTYTGGAHGNSYSTYLNISKKNGKLIPTDQLFADKQLFLKVAESVFRKSQKIPSDAPINSTGFFFENDVFSLPENIGFTDQEVILYYNTYEVNSYANGPIEVKINREEIDTALSSEVL
ncbi:DUF3298 and DUF4163 domain-containing protein [Aquimarina hainanensis]|uniref:DUF3298 and DUF4163 domain-containing protein n=1 Tax=Aquimarina hainanensis TaxID=1578017 RepID=A0ABW5N4A8_9FLAO|nr:DUF3298 and DUF4163 domain-containing protein [Aquimarina sp. TRL1]QKX04905.1 DUF3298 and DUF4163 domain-containing protein [Aquimarina sp. TRL1]